jgi:hypothetical protein
MAGMYDDTPISRFEEDMRAIIDGTAFPDRPPKSKMEELLKELNDTIKAGGGGGGTNDYSQLINKPQINGQELDGNMSTDDLQIEQPLTEQQMNALLALID